MVFYMQMKASTKVIVFGANGSQSNRYINLLKENKLCEIVALVDVVEGNLQITGCGPRAAQIGSLDGLLKEIEFDAGMIFCPHSSHYNYTLSLLQHGKDVIKEKPFARYVQRAANINRLSKQKGKNVYTTLQRRYMPEFIKGKELIEKLGGIYKFNYRYSLNTAGLDYGWRNQRETCLGGVLYDMGYHIIDILQYYFGSPSKFIANSHYFNQHNLAEKLEDSIDIVLEYEDFGGSLSICRRHYQKEETFEIIGRQGSLVITPGTVQWFDQKGSVIEQYLYPDSKQQSMQAMMNHYLESISCKPTDGSFIQAQEQLQNVALIEKIYAEIY